MTGLSIFGAMILSTSPFSLPTIAAFLGLI